MKDPAPGPEGSSPPPVADPSSFEAPEVKVWGVEVWSGAVNTWECDAMGHMNTRFYAAKATEGLVGLAAALGLPEAFSPRANATLLVSEHHIRFLREARAGAALYMRGGVLEIGENEATLLLVIFHAATGEPSASFRTVVRHVTPHDAQPFAWSARTLALAAALAAPMPSYAATRSIELSPVTSQASLQRADALALMTVGGGAVLAQDCDVFGRMPPERFMGRISDGAPRLAVRPGAPAARRDKPVGRIGGAVLEYRLIYLRWPRAGDRLLLRAGLADVGERTQRRIYWLLNPQDGEAWAVAESITVSIDLETRKIAPIPAETRERLSLSVTDGLTL